MGPVVEFDEVGMRYAGGTPVLDGASFVLEAGEFAFLTGPSGAGKTTLIRLVMMATRPTSGTVALFGRDTAAVAGDDLTDLRRRMGVVFQDFRLLDHLTTYENVALPLRVRGREEASYRPEVRDLLQWVGLGDRMDARPPVLSGGEKQRAAIARAVITRPDLVLADEPTGNVDPPLARRLLRLFVELNRMGTSVLVATHDEGLMDQVDAARLHLRDGLIRAG